MRIQIPAIALVTLLILGCGAEQKQDTGNTQTPPPKPILDPPRPAPIVVGTMAEVVPDSFPEMVDGQDYAVDLSAIDSAEYVALQAKAIKTTWPPKGKAPTGIASRKNNCWTLRFGNGKTEKLCDVSEGDGATYYKIVAYDAAKNLVLMRIDFWEGGGMELIDVASGIHYSLYDTPLASSDQRYLASCVNYVETAYMPSGISIYDISVQPPQAVALLGSRDNSWGAQGLAWIAQDAFVFSIFHFTKQSYAFRYFSGKIRKK